MGQPEESELHAPRVPDDLVTLEPVGLEDGFEIEDGLVTGADWSDVAVLDVAIRTSRVEAVTCIGGELGHLRTSDCVFVDCDFSGASLTNINAERVEFRQCRMSGLIASTGSWRDVRFVDCKLDGANFRATKSERLAFEGCLLTEADFYEAKLDGGRLINCDLTRVQLSKASLRRVRLHGSKLTEVKAARQLSGTIISSTQAVPLGQLLLHELAIRIDDGDDND